MAAGGKFTLRATEDIDAAKAENSAMSINANASAKAITMTIHTTDGTKGEALEERIAQMGGKVSVSVGNCCVATLPIDQWQTVTEWPEVKAIDGLSRGGGLFLDNAHAYTHADEVKDETKAQPAGLKNAYDGEGTLMALIDAGIDFSNSAFICYSLIFSSASAEPEKAKVISSCSLAMRMKRSMNSVVVISKKK